MQEGVVSPNPGTRIWMIWAGLIVPACCLGLSLSGANLAEWQSGLIREYAGLLLDRPGTLRFLPLVAYSWLSMLLFAWAPKRFAPSWLVRLGLFAGILIAAQYIALFAAHLFARHHLGELLQGLVAASVAELILLASIRGFDWSRSRWGARRLFYGIAILLGLTWLSGSLAMAARSQGLQEVILGPPAIAGIGLLLTQLVLAPVFALDAYYRAARSSHRMAAFRLPPIKAQILWLLAWLVSWRQAFVAMLEAYADLPPSPDCFVATAAARGHSRWVGAWHQPSEEGGSFTLTRQMQDLKGLELLLSSFSPGLHRPLRRLYDRFGPRFADRLRSPFLADLAWLLLLPMQGFARCAIILVGGIEASRKLCMLYGAAKLSAKRRAELGIIP